MIGRATINGAEASVNNSFITGTVFNVGQTTPPGLAVDDGFIYWTNQPDYPVVGDGVTGSVGRAKIDGTGVNQTFVPNVFFPVGLAVDDAGPGGGPPAVRLVSVAASAKSFAPGSKSTPIRGKTGHGPPKAKPKTGTVFAFTQNTPGKVTIQINKKKAGQKVKGKCRKAKAKRKAKKCDLTIANLFRTSHKGVNTVPFTARIRGKALTPGSYPAKFTASDSRTTSKAIKVNFRILRP